MIAEPAHQLADAKHFFARVAISQAYFRDPPVVLGVFAR